MMLLKPSANIIHSHFLVLSGSEKTSNEVDMSNLKESLTLEDEPGEAELSGQFSQFENICQETKTEWAYFPC